jgi:hypothetical protein
VQQHLTFKFNHHNDCDSFVLHFPDVDYAATAAAITGGGAAVVAGAPDCPVSTTADALFRVTYRGQAEASGTLAGCEHYFLKCSEPASPSRRGSASPL